MTRINLVHPSQLTDKHLIAEYRELPRVFTAVRKLVYTPSPRVGDAWRKFISSGEITPDYVLGKGHVKFFYNKLPWLKDRFMKLSYELRSHRGYTLGADYNRSVIIDAQDLIAAVRGDMLADWEPSPYEIYLNMARLAKRSKIQKVLDELASE